MLENLRSKLKLPSNTRTRTLIIGVGIILFIVAILSLIQFYGRDNNLSNIESKVNKIPSNIQSVPGSPDMSQQYLQVLLQKDQLQATNALKSGASSVPSLVNSGDTDVQSTDFQASNSELQNSQNCNCNTANAMAQQLSNTGAISPDTARELNALSQENLTPDQYANALQQLVAEGKLTPAQAQALLAAYQKQHSDILSQLSPATQAELKNLEQENLTPDQYNARLQQLVREGKLTPAQAAALLAAYKKNHPGATTPGVYDQTLNKLTKQHAIDPTTAANLKAASNQGLSASDYATQVTDLARSGSLTPAQAQTLLAAYQQQHGRVQLSTDSQNDPQLADMQRLQQQQNLENQEQTLSNLAANQSSQQSQQAAQQLQSLATAMSDQSKVLFAAWNPPTPGLKSVGNDQTNSDNNNDNNNTSSPNNINNNINNKNSNKNAQPLQPSMIKTGDILFAVLNTAINSDTAGPVMATIVSGKYQGAKLLGSLKLVSDRVELDFNTMTMPSWPTGVQINAVAINPDTARTAIASGVDHHYLSRYGSLLASSFLEGYGEALENSGTTTVSSSGTVTQTNSTYSPSARTMIALGTAGEKLSTNIEKNFDRAATVVVDPGVGLGILFQKDVQQPAFLATQDQDQAISTQ